MDGWDGAWELAQSKNLNELDKNGTINFVQIKKNKNNTSSTNINFFRN
jgi:hypothetical protein